MSHTVVATFRIKPEHLSDFNKLLADPEHGLSLTRRWKGCVSIQCYIDQDDPNTIVLWEKWEQRQDHVDYLIMRTNTGFFDKVGSMFVAEPVIIHLGKPV
jgi:quinol monooxygenase YgiN